MFLHAYTQIHTQFQAQLSYVPDVLMQDSTSPSRCSMLPHHIMQQRNSAAAPSHSRISSIWDNGNNKCGGKKKVEKLGT